ncbi:MAG TPA: hypothetical protein VHU17_15780, partial [Acidimicrobiales bacterium]|nr:hypothetical protein [Acidimicrobiales bacterium]
MTDPGPAAEELGVPESEPATAGEPVVPETEPVAAEELGVPEIEPAAAKERDVVDVVPDPPGGPATNGHGGRIGTKILEVKDLVQD